MEKGFTLIELLVVVTLIGILAAVAIPRFVEHRAKGFDARALSDLRNVITAEESYFLENGSYIYPSQLPNFNFSDGVVIDVESIQPNDFMVTVYHPRGSKRFCFANFDGAPHYIQSSPLSEVTCLVY